MDLFHLTLIWKVPHKIANFDFFLFLSFYLRAVEEKMTVVSITNSSTSTVGGLQESAKTEHPIVIQPVLATLKQIDPGPFCVY